MLNFLWAGLMGVGSIYAAFSGRLDAVTNAVLDSSKEAVSLCLSMLGILSFWMGLMQIAEKVGVIQSLSKTRLLVF